MKMTQAGFWHGNYGLHRLFRRNAAEKTLWDYDKELYKKRNEIERFFRRLKAYRGIAARYDKLDLMFTAFI